MSTSASAPRADAEPVIRLESVSKRFWTKDQTVHALDRIDLDVAPGEFVSLIGPSGCGKSTLLRVVGGLLERDGGTVAVEGEEPRQAKRHKRFGFVPQAPALLPWRSVRKNVGLLGEVNRRGADHPLLSDAERQDLLERVGLGEFLDALPGELSGGMQQRVSLVRAFVLGAPVLLMDEPFSALDEITRVDMRYLLLDLWERRRTTVLFVTHSIPEAVILSDRVVVLAPRPGRVIDIVDIDLPRPRDEALEDTDEFHAGVARIRHLLREGMDR
ncbi:MAG: ABC transporter ATP-binding protein [Actinomycetota bacterium]